MRAWEHGSCMRELKLDQHVHVHVQLHITYGMHVRARAES